MAGKLNRRWRHLQRKRRNLDSVELNVTAMLDMAFQLLAFFILTFNPSPVESQIALRMPADDAKTQDSGQQPEITPEDMIPSFDLPLPISIFATANGDIEKITLSSKEIQGDSSERTQALFANELAALFKDNDISFDGVKMKVASNLNLERFFQVLDICTKQKLPSGDSLTKISFDPLP